MVEIQRIAGAVVGRVLSGASLDAALAAVWVRKAAHFTSQQRGAIQDIAYGTLRWLGRLQAMLDALLTRPVADEAVRHLLLVALYQLAHTRAAPHAIVDNAVKTCTDLGFGRAKGLVNAVLRSYLRRPAAVCAAADRKESGRYAYPDWWIDKIREAYPACWEILLAHGNQRPPLALRVNVRRTSLDAYLARLAAENMAAQAAGPSAVILDKPVPVDRIPGFAAGEVSVQDAGAQLAAARLELGDGMRVLDACAAPGGKAAHILELAAVRLLALDSDSARLRRVDENLRRLGLSATLLCGDARAPGDWWDGDPFDRILADVPCTASGVVRRHPDIKWLRRSADIARFARVQAEMLDALWPLLVSGGKLLYATCSVFHEENHLQVARFLERHPDARREHIPEEGGEALPPGQILPDARHDGFYYALLRRL